MDAVAALYREGGKGQIGDKKKGALATKWRIADLDGLKLLSDLIQLSLSDVVLGLEFLVLLLPVLNRSLKGNNLLLKVLGLDVSLTELVGGLSEVVVRLLQLLLKESDLLGERLVGGTVSSALLSGTLGLVKLGLQLLNLGFQQAVLVGQRRDLLVLLQVLRLKGLDLLDGILSLFLGSLSLELEGVDFLDRG